ncbi:hypothetical protein [Anaerococcus vaginalis]|uniref:hypothetical protein n=1 Tax=Anaerococcus vaginalis TaxID=33037 RepID=UPI00374295C1
MENKEKDNNNDLNPKIRNTDGGVFHFKIRKKFKIKLRKEIESYIKWYNEERIKKN